MATSHDRYLCKSFSRYTPRAFREHSLDCCIDGVRGADTWGKTLLNKGFATRAGAPWARLRSASRRRRIAHAGGVILAQGGSWRFFDRGGEGGDAGRVLPVDRTAGDFGRTARQVFFSARDVARAAAHMNSRWRWRLSMRFARIRQLGRSGLRRVARVLAGVLTSPSARSRTSSSPASSSTVG